MADGIKELRGQVRAVEEKVDEVAASLDRRFNQVDDRFNQVDAALVELRRYTEFAYERLDAKMDAGLARLDDKVDALATKMDAGFARVERKLDQMIDAKPQARARRRTH